MSFAKATVTGTVIAEPEKRFTPNNHAVTTFVMSVENPTSRDNEPFHLRVTCWRGLADAVETSLQKGDEVFVEGKLIMNSFQSAEGVAKKSFEVEASSLHKLAGKPQPIQAENNSEGGGQPARAPQGQSPAPVGVAAQAQPSMGFENSFSSDSLMADDDIPF